jgi:GT2 family glycosyltransferase
VQPDRQPSAGGESESASASSPLEASIVIVNWNAKPYLLGCLQSLAAEGSGIRSEIIVVDNASSDDSAEAVARDFPAVILVRNQSNLGFARASNVGIARASGRYVFLVNSDIIVYPGAIGAMTAFMDARPRVGMAGPRVLNGDGSLQHSCRNFPGIVASTSNAFALHRLFPGSARLAGELMLHWEHDRERSVDAISGCFCAVRAEALRQVGVLDEEFFLYGEDLDWCTRFRAAGWEIRLCPAAEVIHIGGASSAADRPRFAAEMLRSTLKLYRKHYSAPMAAYLQAMAIIYHVVRLVPRSALYVLWPSRRAAAGMKIEQHLGALSRRRGAGD